MVAPHWPSYRRGLGLGDPPCPVPLDANGNCPTDDLATMAQAGADAGGAINLSNPAAQVQGAASAGFQQITNAAQPAAALGQQLQSQVNQATGQLKAAYQGYANQIQTAMNYPGASAAVSGMITAANGGTPTEAEVQGAFTVAATTAAVALGATATAAATVVAPVCAVVWGAGFALGSFIQKVFGITNAGPIACSSDDHTTYGASPNDPNWFTYDGNNGPMIGQPMGRYAPTQAENVAQMRSVAGGPSGAPADWPFWMPYTRGAFENWARPLIIKAEELWANCKTVPPDNTATSFLKGLIGTWNAQSLSGGAAVTRQICIAGLGQTPLDEQIAALSDTTFQTSFRPPLYWQLMAWQADPIQMLLGQVSNEQGGNIAIRVVDPSPTSVIGAGAAAAGQMSTAAKVAVGTVAVGGAALAGTVVYAFAKGQAVRTVFQSGWTALKGWFVK